MLDQPLVIRVAPSPSAKRLADQIKRRAPLLRCSACESREFALLEEPGVFRSIIPRENQQRGLGVGMTSSHTVSLLVCTTCGRAEVFSDGVIIENAQPEDWGVDSDSLA